MIEVQEGEILKWEYQLDLKFNASSRTLASRCDTLDLCLAILSGSNSSFGDISSFKDRLLVISPSFITA